MESNTRIELIALGSLETNKILFLFTKKFPYGHQETYLFDELPYLVEKFREVVIIPYDEYNYFDNENRVASNLSIKVFKINKKTLSLSVSEKIKREILILSVLFQELLIGREKIKHIKNVKSITSQLRHLFLNALALKKIISENYNEKDTLIFYNYWLHRGVLLSHFAKKIISNPIKIYSRAHAYDLYHNDWLKMLDIKTTMFLPFEFFKIKICDKIFSISEHGINHFKKLHRKQVSKFSIARLGVKHNPSTIKSSSDFDTNAVKVIISCSAIDERKRIYLMPEILSKLNFKFKWIHIGSGTSENIERVKNEIEKYKLQSNCELKGLVAHSEIIELYKSTKVDLFFNLSTAEGIPVSLMEAASFGIPMIATNTVGNPEIVNNTNGFLIDVNFNPKEIADRLNTHFQDASSVLKKREAAYKTFDMYYSASKNYTDFVNTINQLANAS